MHVPRLYMNFANYWFSVAGSIRKYFIIQSAWQSLMASWWKKLIQSWASSDQITLDYIWFTWYLFENLKTSFCKEIIYFHLQLWVTLFSRKRHHRWLHQYCKNFYSWSRILDLRYSIHGKPNNSWYTFLVKYL